MYLVWKPRLESVTSGLLAPKSTLGCPDPSSIVHLGQIPCMRHATLPKHCHEAKHGSPAVHGVGNGALQTPLDGGVAHRRLVQVVGHTSEINLSGWNPTGQEAAGLAFQGNSLYLVCLSEQHQLQMSTSR